MKKMNRLFAAFGVAATFLSVSCRDETTFYSNVMRSEVYFQLSNDSKYDFLWVFDNSPTMAVKRTAVMNNMNKFLTILTSRKAIDYQMAVTTTDYFTQLGDLVKNNAGLEVVKSSTSADPAADFNSIIAKIDKSDTDFWEQGLVSAKEAVRKHGSKFMRSNVPLIIVFGPSDENDFSCKGMMVNGVYQPDTCWGIQPEDQKTTDPEYWVPFEVASFVDYFSQIKKSENTFVSAFPIVGLNKTDCFVPTVGSRYVELAEGLGGVSTSGSVCNSQMQTAFESIAQVIADRGMVFALSQPADEYGINVYVDQVLIPNAPENYRFDAQKNQIIFTGAAPKKGAVVEITYAQKN